MPVTAVSTLKSIILGVVFNRSIRPIKLSSVSADLNENEEVSRYLHDLTTLILDTLFNPKSGFERALSSAIDDDIVIGTMATFIEQGKNYPLKFYTIPIQNFLIDENDEKEVDTVILKFEMTARQIMQKFESVPEVITKFKDDNRKFDIELHIMPRKERDKKSIHRNNMPIAGYWINKDHLILLEETGWESMPVAVGRSEVTSGELYGTSRTMIALADAKEMNEMSRLLSEATELTVRPPLVVNANFEKRINISQGALNYTEARALATGQKPIEQIHTIGSVSLNYDLLMRKENSIKEALFLDKLKILDNPNATATQILELKAEMFRIMGDFSTGIIDYLNQILDRTLTVLLEQIYDKNYNLVNPALFDKELPDSLRQNPELKIDYLNPITQSQRQVESLMIDKLIDDVMGIAQVNPSVLNKINFNKVIRRKIEISGLDADLIKSDEEVQEIEEMQQAQQHQQQQAEMDNLDADTINKLNQ